MRRSWWCFLLFIFLSSLGSLWANNKKDFKQLEAMNRIMAQKICPLEGPLLEGIWNYKKIYKFEKMYKKINFLKLKKKSHQIILGMDEAIIIPDLHGSLSGFVDPLLRAHLIKWDKKNPWRLYNMKSETHISCSDLSSLNNEERHHVLIQPNIEWKEKSLGRVVLLGDYLDRGEFPIELFYTIYSLLQKQEGENERKLTALLGNHEGDLLLDSQYAHITPTLFFAKDEIEALKKEKKESTLNTALLRQKVRERVFATLQKGLQKEFFQFFYYDRGVVFSHSFFTVEFIKELIENPLMGDDEKKRFQNLLAMKEAIHDDEKKEQEKWLLEFLFLLNGIGKEERYQSFLLTKEGPLWARVNGSLHPLPNLPTIMGHSQVKKPGVAFKEHPFLHFLDTGIYHHGPSFALWRGKIEKLIYFVQ